MAGSIFDPLLQPNATVTIYAITASRDAAGGTVQTLTAIESDVPVLVSQTGGARDGRFESDTNLLSGTISGDSTNLGKPNTIIYFSSGFAITGVYARVDNTVVHGPSLAPDTWIPAWRSLKWSQVQIANS